MQTGNYTVYVTILWEATRYQLKTARLTKEYLTMYLHRSQQQFS